MKEILSIKLLLLGIILLVFSACKKDYIIGGSIEDVNMYKNTSSYDVLKSNPLYDTLVQVIDAAGFKDRINEAGNTFFAPSDYSIFNYLDKRTRIVQNTNVNGKFGLDSLLYYVTNNVKGTRDSLLMYLIKQPLTYSSLTNTGAYYSTGLTNHKAIISYEYTTNGNLGNNTVVSGNPRIVYYTHLWYAYNLSDAHPASDVPLNIGVHTLIKTSGIETKNGIMNALENSHVLFFFGTKQ